MAEDEPEFEMAEGDFDPREFYPLIAKTMAEAGWNDPEMDDYDRYDEIMESRKHPRDLPMAIYGYSKRVVNEHGLHEMSEVTINVSVADLRQIALFLSGLADRVESGDWRSSHEHLTDFDKGWDQRHPDSDMIVINPAPEPPKLAT